MGVLLLKSSDKIFTFQILIYKIYFDYLFLPYLDYRNHKFQLKQKKLGRVHFKTEFLGLKKYICYSILCGYFSAKNLLISTFIAAYFCFVHLLNE